MYPKDQDENEGITRPFSIMIRGPLISSDLKSNTWLHSLDRRGDGGGENNQYRPLQKNQSTVSWRYIFYLFRV